LATVGGRRAFVAARVIRRPLRGNTALVVARFSIEMQRRNIRTAYPTESNIARVHLAPSFPADADGLPRFLPLGQPPLRPLRDKIGHLLPAATWGHALLRITGFSLVHFKNRQHENRRYFWNDCVACRFELRDPVVNFRPSSAHRGG
jgi:hypothetical protein